MHQDRPKTTKDALSAAALSLFAQRGYGAVSMRDIAEAVGVRQGAIYNHFASKQDLLATLMTTHMEAVLAAADDAIPVSGAPADQLAAFARFHVSYHIDFPDDVFIAYMEMRNLEPDNLRDIKALRARYEDRLKSILAAGTRAGTFAVADVAVQTRALLAMLTGVTQWYRDGGRLTRDAVVDAYVQAALQSVGLPPRDTD